MIKCKHSKHSKHSKKKHAQTQQVVAKQILRNSKGQLLPGSAPLSPGGRRPLGKSNLDKLLQSIARVESAKNKNLVDHYVLRAYKNDNVLCSLMRKLFPDLQAVGIKEMKSELDEQDCKDIQNVLRERFNIIEKE